MPRLNVDDSIRTDSRFIQFCIKVGDYDSALGKLIRAWWLAQDFYCPNRLPIPMEEWNASGIGNHLIESGLARVVEGGIHVAGSEEAFSWLLQCHDAGKRSAAKRGKKIPKKSLPPLNPRSTPVQHMFNGGSTSLPLISINKRDSEDLVDSASNQELLENASRIATSLPLVANEGGELVGVSEETSTEVALPKRSRYSDSTRAKMRGFIASYVTAYKARYGVNPEGARDKAILGKLASWIENVSEEKANQLIQVYLQISHRYFDENCHDLWTFFRHLNRIGNALATGQNPDAINWAKVFGGAS